MVSCLIAAPQASFNGAFLFKKVRHYSLIFTRGFVASCFIEEHGGKGFSTRFLLADGHQWCNATQVMRSYRGCQYFVGQIHAPAQELLTNRIILPFAVWGMDLLGPFKKVLGGLTHLLIAAEKFTKWIMARPLAKIGSKEVVNFVQDIIFCFGVPNFIFTYNDT
jgi:hypothetical protein